MTLVPRILLIAQGTVVDIPHTAECLVQVVDLFRRRVTAVAIGAIGHLQMIHPPVNSIYQQLSPKEVALAGDPLSLSATNGGVSRGEA